MKIFVIGALFALATQAALAAPVWTPIDNTMTDGRWAPSAVLLQDNTKALIAGGYSFDTARCVTSADLYDSKTHRFIPCHGRLTFPRDFATASLLPDGKVLIAGGYNTTLGTLRTAEVYDPTTDRFSVLDSQMSVGRELFQVTTLRDGRILLTGGLDLSSRRTQSSADLFDPKTMTFTRVPSQMHDDRFGHTMALLADGRVLVLGGNHWIIGKSDKTWASAEIFDPSTNLFHTAKGAMSVPRNRPSVTLLPDGKVLIAGGQNGQAGPHPCEIFDPATEMFTPFEPGLGTARMAHSDVTLPNGQIFLAGGWAPDLKATTNSTEFFDPATQQFHMGPPMPSDFHDGVLIAFPDGQILEAGGKQVQPGHETGLSSGAYLLPEAPQK